jgi:hypothetical protein
LACIADAQSLESYVGHLVEAGLQVTQTETHNHALTEMVQQVRIKLLGVEMMKGLKKIGEVADNKVLKGVVVELGNGQKLPAAFKSHCTPPTDGATDFGAREMMAANPPCRWA